MRRILYLICLGFLGLTVSAESSSPTAAGSFRVLMHYALTSANDFQVRDPRDWRLLGSTNGGQSWIQLDHRTNQIFLERYETKHFTTAEKLPCNAFRLEVLQVRDPKSATSVQIAEIELKGIFEGQEMADLRPRRSDIVTVQGEFAPIETRRMVFDGDLQTKWLDFSPIKDDARSTWIQWQYDSPNDVDPDPVEPITRVADLNAKARTWVREPFRLEIKATVIWRSPKDNYIVLNDASGAALVKTGVELGDLKAGTEITLSGSTFLVRERGAVELQIFPVVKNDGLHAEVEKSGTMFLRAGKHPITVEWFNARGGAGLLVEYEGPGLLRQPIPDSSLFRKVTGKDSLKWEQGLNYSYYEGEWRSLPVFCDLKPVTEGVTSSFDITKHAREHNYGFAFNGFLEVPRDGEYRFYITSDDGSQLYLGPRHLRINPVGQGTLPQPFRMPAGVVVTRRDTYRWVQAEGEITFIGEGKNGWELVLQSREGPMSVFVGTPSEPLPHYALHSRARIEGICFPTLAPDQYRVAGELVTPSVEHLRLMGVGPRHWRSMPPSTLSSYSKTDSSQTVRLRGKLSESNGELTLTDGTGTVQVISSMKPEPGTTRSAEVMGRLHWTGKGPVLKLAVWRELGEPAVEGGSLPLLRYVEQVHGLSPEEATRGYPVTVRGVVTSAWPDSDSAVIQDGTRGIFVPNLSSSFDDWPEVGDFFELEGKTDPGGFAPVIIADRVSRLGKGAMPDPFRPTWAQLMNGSMDAQYVEIRGVVSSVEGEFISLLMKSGRLRIQMETIPPEKLLQYENAVVRLRGCVFASWSGETRKVIPGELKIRTASISMERDAPRDFFSVPKKRAADLLLFDAQADDLQRVKVTGQVLHERNGILFIGDGETGVRVMLKSATSFAPGDIVEVVGFPRTEGPAVVLRDAIARKVDWRKVPNPREMSEAGLFLPENDATRVLLRPIVINIRANQNEQIMELQAGLRTFLAYVKSGRNLKQTVPPGSLIEIVGVYAGNGSSDQRGVESFDLLVNSTNDVRVLQTPSWWSLRHSAGAIAAISVVLLAAASWIRALRREVGKQTQKLQKEVDERKNAEEIAHRARLEAESAREAAEAGSRAKSQFLATISHEIRTPMNGILGMNNLLLDSGLTREQRELSETVNTSGEALLSILNDVLDFSKIEAGKMTLDRIEFSLREAVEGAVDLIAQRAQKKGLELNYWIDESLLGRLAGDEGRFRQVLLNLLSNAVKFTEAGEVFLEIQPESAGPNSVMLRASVRDTGIGITPEVQERLFSPFEQADQSTTRKYGGTGLGLAICKRLVELMGGSMGVHSENGQGSTFWFTANFETVHSTITEPSSELLAGARLLIIEDSETTAQVLRELASGWKMEAAVASNLDATSRQVAEIMGQRQNERLLVLIDAATSEMDGLAIAAELRTRHPNLTLRVALLTSIHDRPSARDLSRAEISSCLSKPVRKGQLRSALLTLVRESLDTAILRKTPPAPPKPEPKSTRILLAEDNIVNQRVAQKQLQRLGYTADVVCNGVEVLQALANSSYDIILMDCHMPEMDGYEATRRIRQLPNSFGKVRIIAMTANAMQGDREKCLESGMDDYVSKPVKIEDLRAALEGGCATLSVTVPV